MKKQITENLYALVANEEDARICKDISEDACREVPGNFFTIATASVLTKLGDNLASPKTVLTWLMGYVGAPLYLVAMLVPLRESGSMLPQLFIGGVIRQRPRRKPVWILGSLLQFLAVTLIGLSAFTLSGVAAGWAIIFCLTLFSLARGLCSVSAKDLVGKTIPKTRRGRLGGLSASLSGLLAAAIGIWMLTRGDQDASPGFYGGLLASAGGLWLLAALIFTHLKEEPGETAGGGNAFREALLRLDLLRSDTVFRRFLLTRALLLCTALSAPYYVLLARSYSDADLSLLGTFILANGLAATLSAPIWGLLADTSSRRVLITAAAIASLLGVALFGLVTWLPALASRSWLYPPAFFVLAVSHSGVRAGRKTYLVDMAGGVKRLDYVAVSNSLIGLILLLVGAFSGVMSFLAPEGMILMLSGFGLAGAVLGRSLPEVQ